MLSRLDVIFHIGKTATSDLLGVEILKISNLVVAGAVLLLVANSTQAHHGFTAHFDPDNIIRIEGTVKEFEFVNPHSYLRIDTFDESGNPIVYTCDLQAKNQLVRRGADETLFTIGEHIIIEGFQARRDPLGCEFGVGYFDDGSTYTMRSLGAASTQFATDIEVTREESSIFGVWIRPGMNGDASGRGPSSGYDSITEAGLAALQDYDPILDHPGVHCRQGSPVRTWGVPGLATSITRVGDNVQIYHESMDTTRIIHINQTEIPEGIEATDMGYSVGRFDGDDLLIDTSNFGAGVISGSNLNSAEMSMQERLTVLDNGRLHISWVLSDPLFYTEQMTGSQTLQPIDQEVIPYECIPGWIVK